MHTTIKKGDEAKSKGQYNLAEKWYIKGKELAEGDNKDPAASKHLAYNKLRNLYIATGQYDDAIAYGRKVLEEYQKQMNQRKMRIIFRIAWWQTSTD